MKKLVIKIELKGKEHTANIDLPENWGEVPADIYAHLASLYMATEKEMSVYDKAVRAFALLTWKHWEVIQQLEPEELYDLLPLADWVFNKLDLTKNHLPEIKIGDQIFIGPADGMDNLRFGEWCAAAFHSALYADDSQIEHLNDLAACLYRPAGTGPEFTPDHSSYRGDRRERFNDQILDSRAKVMSKLERPVLLGIYVWFCSCRYQVFNLYEELKASQPASGTAPIGNWLEVYDDLRGDPKFAPAEKLEDEFLHNVLFSLQRNKIKMDELKDRYKI